MYMYIYIYIYMYNMYMYMYIYLYIRLLSKQFCLQPYFPKDSVSLPFA